jgi:hypothetical protein
MPYIGNTVQTQGFAPAIDYFNGNGVTVTFTLSRPVASVAQMIVAIDNVIQNPSSSFTVAGNAITFTSAPLAGTNNIWVEYTSLITTYQGISQDPTVIGDIRATGGYLAEGDFGNSFVDGAIFDYVTGAGRVTVGELDDIVFYHGGTAGRSEMMKLSYAGNSTLAGNLTTTGVVGIGTTTLNGAELVVNTGGIDTPSTSGNMTSGVLVQVGPGSQALNFGNDGTGSWYNAAFANNAGVPLAHRWLTGGTERMRISSTGVVTTPAQPAFRAYHSGNINWNSGALNPIVYDVTAFNTGSYYNTSTGAFTAPVAGVYSFAVWEMYMGESTFTFTYLGIQINGAVQIELMRQGERPDYSTFGGTFLVSLAANDTVRVNLGTAGVDSGYLRGGSTFNAFMGYLVG